MDTIPTLSEESITPLFDTGSFQRGQQYYNRGYIFEARRQGMTLKARCRGSYDNSYRVGATFDADGVSSTVCSCPIGGSCKHAVALLLTWINAPGAFTHVEDVEATLKKRSKAELIALVKQMLRQQPDLETLLEIPLPTSGKKGAPISASAFRKRADALFGRMESAYGGPGDAGHELVALTAIGDGYAAQGDYAGAAAVYEGISASVLDNYEMYSEDDELSMVIEDCVHGLAACLDGARDDPTREVILRALFAVYRFDVDFGGVGLSHAVPDLLVERTGPDERRVVAAWVREQIAAQRDDQYGSWHRESYGELLLDLEKDTLDDDSYIAVCRETGRLHDLVERLLSLGRVDEALADADGAGDYELLDLADLFVAHGYGAMAESMVRARIGKSDDQRLPTWLKNRYKARGDDAAALELARSIFRAHPSLEGYQEVRDLATRRDRWEPLRPTLIMFLRDNKDTDLLIKIYLDEGEIDHALETLAARQDTAPYSYGYSYMYGHDRALDVAAAAEQTRPAAAIDIYRRRVEQLIAAQGRPNYQQACRLLTRVRACYQQLGDEEAWAAYMADLRERNRRLRALTEELKAAGL